MNNEKRCIEIKSGRLHTLLLRYHQFCAMDQAYNGTQYKGRGYLRRLRHRDKLAAHFKVMFKRHYPGIKRWTVERFGSDRQVDVERGVGGQFYRIWITG